MQTSIVPIWNEHVTRTTTRGLLLNDKHKMIVRMKMLRYFHPPSPSIASEYDEMHVLIIDPCLSFTLWSDSMFVMFIDYLKCFILTIRANTHRSIHARARTHTMSNIYIYICLSIQNRFTTINKIHNHNN